MPLRPEPGKRRKAGNGDQQNSKRYDNGRMPECWPVPELLLADVTRKPEQAGLGKQVVDEQSADNERNGVTGPDELQGRHGDDKQTHLPDRGIAEQTPR